MSSLTYLTYPHMHTGADQSRIPLSLYLWAGLTEDSALKFASILLRYSQLHMRGAMSFVIRNLVMPFSI
jgi:hypothetical protein